MKHKRLFWFFLFSVLYAWFGKDGLNAQTKISPDCSIPLSFTAAGRSSSFPVAQTGCVGWIMTYQSTGFSALSIELDQAADSSGSPGSWSAFSGTTPTLTGCGSTNPLSNTTGGCYATNGAVAWVSVNLSGLTGSGTVKGFAYGCRIDNCAALFQAAGGGGGTQNVNVIELAGNNIHTDTAGNAYNFLGCTSSAEVALSGTGYTEIVAGTAAQVIRICKIFVTSASGGSPVVNTFSIARATVTTCGTATELLSAAAVTGIDSDFGGAMQSGSGQSICVSESTANSDKVTIVYSKF